MIHTLGLQSVVFPWVLWLLHVVCMKNWSDLIYMGPVGPWKICSMLLSNHMGVWDPWQLSMACPIKICVSPLGWLVFKLVGQTPDINHSGLPQNSPEIFSANFCFNFIYKKHVCIKFYMYCFRNIFVDSGYWHDIEMIINLYTFLYYLKSSEIVIDFVENPLCHRSVTFWHNPPSKFPQFALELCLEQRKQDSSSLQWSLVFFCQHY